MSAISVASAPVIVVVPSGSPVPPSGTMPVVATPTIPVGTPARIPELTRAPLRERTGLGLRDGRGTYSPDPQDSPHCENRYS